jgi:membrane fusion protein (multidrug efflux system)
MRLMKSWGNVQAGWAAAVLALAAMGAGCGRADSSAPAPAASLRQVSVIRVMERQPRLGTDLPAELSAYQDAKLQARVSGFIQHLYADRGSRVRQGQVLALLEAPDLVAQRNQAEQRLKSAAALRLEAQAALDRDQATAGRLHAAAQAMAGAVAENDVHVADQAVAADQAEVASRQAAEQAAQAALNEQIARESYLRVLAPFPGVVIRRDASEGTLAGPSAPALFEMQQLDPLRLTVDVPEAEAVGTRLGETLSFTVANQPQREFRGVVARIAHSVRPESRTMPVELDVPNPGLVLAPGMYARVKWRFERAQPSLFVPATAVLHGTERTEIELAAGGRIRRVTVTTGFADGNLIEIFGAVHAGDAVVTDADPELQNGQAVGIAR